MGLLERAIWTLTDQATAHPYVAVVAIVAASWALVRAFMGSPPPGGY